MIKLSVDDYWYNIWEDVTGEEDKALALQSGHLRICEYEENRNCILLRSGLCSRVEIGQERDACMVFLPQCL